MMGAMPKARPERGYFDSRFAARIIHVAPGAHEIAADADEVLSTVLGSCVAACISDRETREGGMNHFLLPGEGGADLALSGEDLRLGVNAMEILINALLRRGARRARLEAKVFGGASFLGATSAPAIGERNAAFVRRFLTREGIPILREDLGGDRPRRLNYQPATGRAWVSRLDNPRLKGVLEAESDLRARLHVRSAIPNLEIFR